MFCSDSYLKDLEKQINRIDLEELRNKKILVTGATGLICSYIIDLLIYANITKKTNITILAMGRNKDNLKNRFNYYFKNDLFVPIIQDVCNKIQCNDVNYVIHGASNANPKLYIEDPVGTMNANYLGTLNLLELCKTNKAKMVFISSGDIYGYLDNPGEELSEDDYGNIDILNVKSSYPSSKRAAETLCSSYSSQYRVNVSIVRPAHIYGPTCTKSDTRAVSDFINKASNNEDIIMKSDGSSLRSYCYVGDAAIGILKVLINGESANAYNISNNNCLISIRELAEIVCKYSNSKLIIEIPNNEIDKKIDTNVKLIKLSSKKIEMLGWNPEKKIDDGIKLTLQILKEKRNNSSLRLEIDT